MGNNFFFPFFEILIFDAFSVLFRVFSSLSLYWPQPTAFDLQTQFLLVVVRGIDSAQDWSDHLQPTASTGGG